MQWCIIPYLLFFWIVKRAKHLLNNLFHSSKFFISIIDKYANHMIHFKESMFGACKLMKSNARFELALLCTHTQLATLVSDWNDYHLPVQASQFFVGVFIFLRANDDQQDRQERVSPSFVVFLRAHRISFALQYSVNNQSSRIKIQQ